jgi:hypothetical protein
VDVDDDHLEAVWKTTVAAKLKEVTTDQLSSPKQQEGWR